VLQCEYAFSLSKVIHGSILPSLNRDKYTIPLDCVECVATCCSALQCSFIVLQRVAVRCSVSFAVLIVTQAVFLLVVMQWVTVLQRWCLSHYPFLLCCNVLHRVSVFIVTQHRSFVCVAVRFSVAAIVTKSLFPSVMLQCDAP